MPVSAGGRPISHYIDVSLKLLSLSLWKSSQPCRSAKLLFVWIIYYSHGWYLQLNLDNEFTDTSASDSEQPVLSLDWVTPQDHKHLRGSMGSVVIRSSLGQKMWVLLPPLAMEAASSAGPGAHGSWRLYFGYHSTKQWSAPSPTFRDTPQVGSADAKQCRYHPQLLPGNARSQEATAATSPCGSFGGCPAMPWSKPTSQTLFSLPPTDMWSIIDILGIQYIIHYLLISKDTSG